MRKPGNRCAPENVFAGLTVPGIRKVLRFRYARSLCATEGWPVSLSSIRTSGRANARACNQHDSSRRYGPGLFCRRPKAAVDNRPADDTIVRHDIEAYALAVYAKSIPAGPVTTTWAT